MRSVANQIQHFQKKKPIIVFLVDLDDTFFNLTEYMENPLKPFRFNEKLIQLIINTANTRSEIEVCIVTAQCPGILKQRKEYLKLKGRAYFEEVAENTYAPNVAKKFEALLRAFDIQITVQVCMASDCYYRLNEQNQPDYYGFGKTAANEHNCEEHNYYKDDSKPEGRSIQPQSTMHNKQYLLALTFRYLKDKYKESAGLHVFWFDDTLNNVLLNNLFTNGQIREELKKTNKELEDGRSTERRELLTARKKFLENAVGIDDPCVLCFMAIYMPSQLVIEMKGGKKRFSELPGKGMITCIMKQQPQATRIESFYMDLESFDTPNLENPNFKIPKSTAPELFPLLLLYEEATATANDLWKQRPPYTDSYHHRPFFLRLKPHHGAAAPAISQPSGKPRV